MRRRQTAERIAKMDCLGRAKERFDAFESLDYEVCESVMYRESRLGKNYPHHRRRIAVRWLITILIGFSVALLVYAMHWAVYFLANVARLNLTMNILTTTDDKWKGYFAFLLSSLLLASISTAVVAYIEPAAASSGVSEVKAYLNGVKVPKVLRMRTFIVKVVSLVFAAAAGFPVGKLGPMVHLGAICGAGFSQGSKTLRADFRFNRNFRSDHDKRDFVSMGAAAGASAAFGAPIGGTLLSLEGTSSFWRGQLTWRTFIACIAATFLLNLLLIRFNFEINVVGSKSLIDFDETSATPVQWRMEEVPFFAFLGVCGGLFGASFIYINTYINRVRRKSYVLRHRALGAVVEALILIAIASSLYYWLPAVFPCAPIARFSSADSSLVSSISDSSDSSPALSVKPRAWYTCKSTQYNEMASLTMVTQEDAVRVLLRRDNNDAFTGVTLITYFVMLFSLLVVTYGAYVGGGVFVPCILMGGALGRAIASVLQNVFPFLSPNAGVYALVGAAAVLGGVQRRTISLAITILEITNDIQFLFPVIAVIIISKSIADSVTPSLYDAHLALIRAPYLPEEPKRNTIENFSVRRILERTHRGINLRQMPLALSLPQVGVSGPVELVATDHARLNMIR